MDKQAINKELTELLGIDDECETGINHSYVSYNPELPWDKKTRTFCKNCGKVSTHFFTNEGYGKLIDIFWKWDIEKQLRFFAFLEKTTGNIVSALELLGFFHKDNFAPLMLEFLKGEG